jgi:hypothetical protein
MHKHESLYIDNRYYRLSPATWDCEYCEGTASGRCHPSHICKTCFGRVVTLQQLHVGRHGFKLMLDHNTCDQGAVHHRNPSDRKTGFFKSWLHTSEQSLARKSYIGLNKVCSLPFVTAVLTMCRLHLPRKFGRHPPPILRDQASENRPAPTCACSTKA